MSKLTEKRIEIIDRLMRQYGIEHGDKIFISLWDLAYNINNTWNAKYFVNEKRFQSDSKHGYVLKFHQVHHFFRAIKATVKKSGWPELRESYNNKSEYLVIKNQG